MHLARFTDVAKHVPVMLVAALALGASLMPGGAAVDVATPAVTLPSLIEDASRRIAANVRAVQDGRHLGFDTNLYPGDRTMQAWRGDDSPYEWVGYYLPAPCHRDTTWVGKRTTLQGMGWGIAVVYVGQQSWGTMGRSAGTARKGRRTRRSDEASNCASAFVTAARGALDAVDAILRTEQEGFPHGTTIFLDIERMELLSPSMRAYYRAWTAGVLADGRYRPGVYAHTDNASKIYDDVRSVFVAAGDSREPQFWVAGRTRHFAPDKAPTDVGHSFADVWQGRLDIVDTQNGVRLPIDVSVARVPSPSQEYAYGE